MNNKILKTIHKIKKEIGTYDPFIISEKLNIEIMYVNFLENPMGQFVEVKGTPLILINDSIEGTNMEYFVLAHELFHFIHHSELGTFYISHTLNRGKIETEANRFAALLMIKLYKEENDHYPTNVKQLWASYGVPQELFY